jgi:long-chain acyl-CoA synthetase
MRVVFRIEVTGLENVPRRTPFLITPNHASLLDPFALGAALGAHNLKGIYWSGWVRAAFGNPLKRGISRLAKTVPVNPQLAAVSSLALGAAVLRRGHALVWFPEGTRSTSGRIEVFRAGIGLLLAEHEVPTLPVIIRGSFEAWPVGRRFPHPHPIQVIFGRPVSPRQLEELGSGDSSAERITSGLRAIMLEMAGGGTEQQGPGTRAR